MTDFLRMLLLWTGIGLALLASVVVAPDALPRLGRKIRAVAYRYLPFLRSVVQVNAGDAAFGSDGVLAVDDVVVDLWNPYGSVDERIQRLRDQVVELREMMARTKGVLRAELNRKIADVTAQLEAVRSDVSDLRSAFTEVEERSSDLDARGLPSIGFGILLSGAPAELASVPWLAIILGAVGLALVVWCIVVLVKHYVSR